MNIYFIFFTLRTLLFILKNDTQITAVEDVRCRFLVEKLEDYDVLMVDVNGLITAWNKGVEVQFDHEEKEVLGKNFSLIFTKEDKRLGLPKKGLGEAKKLDVPMTSGSMLVKMIRHFDVEG